MGTQLTRYSKLTYASLRPLLFIVAVVLTYRLVYMQLLSSLENEGVDTPSLLNIPLLLVLAIGGYFFVRYMNRRIAYGSDSVLRFSFELLYLIIGSIGVSLVVSMGRIAEAGIVEMLRSGELGLTFLGVLLLNTVILYIINIAQYVRDAQRRALREQIVEKNRAHYQYHQLKRQLDPHFLFNSLSVLDSLVEIDTTRARNFIHKLAEVYRYLLASEDHNIIGLKEELKFVNSYLSLMKERFGDGIVLKIDVPSVVERKYFVIPCSLQILVENAIKHNVISTSEPLIIQLYTTDQYIVMKNNLQPKLGDDRSSTGVGLRYIEVRYAEFTDRTMSVKRSDTSFEVTLPLLEGLQRDLTEQSQNPKL